MKILFDLQGFPFFLAHGGVSIQVLQTKSALQRCGVEVEFLRWWDESQKADLIHCFGRASTGHINAAHARGIAYVMTDLLTAQGSRGTARVFAESLRNRLVSMAGGERLRRMLAWQPYRSADAIVALTDWEAALMCKLYGAKRERVHVIPNGVERLFFEPGEPACRRGNELLCVATITPRKRQIELAQAAVAAGVRLRFVGRPYSESDPYYQDFLRIVRANSASLTYVGEVESRSRLAELYRGACGFVLLSSMESQCLASLEAAACGCPLLLCDLPWARETFGPSASYASTHKTDRWAAMLQAFARGNNPPPTRPLTWDDVAVTLIRLYAAITDK